MKNARIVRCGHFLWVGICGGSNAAIAGKPAPTVFKAFSKSAANIDPCGSGLARDDDNRHTTNPNVSHKKPPSPLQR
ncbi:hypothetical protein [Pseudomonas azerbaijanoccidentalis]